jgi:hypothetical protein
VSDENFNAVIMRYDKQFNYEFQTKSVIICCLFSIVFLKQTVFRILAKKETLHQVLTMTSHTVNILKNKHLSSLLRHEGIYDYNNDAFLQIYKRYSSLNIILSSKQCS